MSAPVQLPPQVPGTAPMAPPYQQAMMATVAVINGNTTSAQTIIAAVTNPNKAVKIFSMYFVVQSSCTVTFNDQVNTDGALPLGNGGAFTLDVRSNGDPWFQTSSGGAFTITTSIATPIVGRAYYQAI